MKRGGWALLALGVGVVWLVGLVALGIWNEDACMAVGVPSASAYTQSLRVWPPALVCEYRGAGLTETVLHTVRGVVIVGWTYLVPPLALAGLLVRAAGSAPPKELEPERQSGGSNL